MQITRYDRQAQTSQPHQRQDFRQRLQQVPGIHPYFVQHICAVAQDYQDGVFAGTNDAVERLTGTPPMTVEAYVRAHAAAFAR